MYANNDEDSLDAPRQRRAILLEALELPRDVSLAGLCAALTDERRRDGRDQILVVLDKTDGSQCIVLLWADEFENFDKVEVGSSISVNGLSGCVFAVDDENEDGVSHNAGLLRNSP